MGSNPTASFYWNDWDNEELLKPCTLAAQGLWMRMLCLAARSPEHGVVQIGSLNCSLPDGLTHIASAVGRPLHEIAPLIDELLSSGTASLDRQKRIYCRRMVRAAALHKKRSEAGHNGAAVTNGKKRETEICRGKMLGKVSANGPPSSRLHSFNLESETPTSSEANSTARRARGADKRGTRLAEDWQPSAAERDFARDLGLDADLTAEEFRDYWTALPGQRGTKLDWGKTFKNRCRELAARAARGRPHQTAADLDASTRAAIARSKARFGV